MKTRTFHKYDDPGHGWVKVSKVSLVRLGIAGEISSYSYERGDYAYLEEDCDLAILCKALEARGISYKFVYHHTNKQSKICGYNCYRSTNVED